MRPPVGCGDWHGDGVQGYDGPHVNMLNVTIDMDATSCGGTAPFFYPSGQGNTSATIDRLLIAGPNRNYSFRLGMPGTVRHLRIEDRSWSFGPIDVKCSAITAWDAKIVGPVSRTDGGYAEPAALRDQSCNTNGGSSARPGRARWVSGPVPTARPRPGRRPAPGCPPNRRRRSR